MEKEYYWILMEKISDEGDLTRTRLVPRGTNGCYSMEHDKVKEVFTWSGEEYEKLNNL